MKKKWQIIAVLMLALLTLLSVSAPAMAQEDEEVAAPAITGRGALAIIAPWTVPAGKEFTVRAFLREDQEPFPGAGVWAIGQDSAGAAKEALRQLKDANSADVELDYQGILETYGAYLGQTGQDGRLACTIDRPGRYILVAACNGYLPGFTSIHVRDTVNALGIRAPRRAPAGEPVTMVVFERITQDTVEDAAVFAITRDNAEAWKQAALALKEDTIVAAGEKDYEALCNTYGFFLGWTDENGKLEYTFDETGVYLLVAVMKGYYPGFTTIAIGDGPNVLGIKANPPRAQVGENVTLNVFERKTQDPVAEAGIWALSREDGIALMQEIKTLRETAASATAATDYAAVVAAHGTFLGSTDVNGRFIAAFDTPGIYLLVTVKPGYFPGFTVLPVKDLPEPGVTANSARTQKWSGVPSMQLKQTDTW